MQCLSSPCELVCVFDNGGVLLDSPNVVTLQNPEEHSFHCLLDVGVCAASGYQVLGTKDPTTDRHCPGFRLSESTTPQFRPDAQPQPVSSEPNSATVAVNSIGVYWTYLIVDLLYKVSPPAALPRPLPH